MTRVHLLTTLLPLLWCISSVIARDGCTPASALTVAPDAEKDVENGGFVDLMNSTTIKKGKEGVLEDDTKVLWCKGYGSPRGKITWYRYYNDSGCLRDFDIHEYWSSQYHYEINSTSDRQGRVDSTLTIRKFSKGYEGLHYCVLTNGDNSAVVHSPVMNLTFVPQPDFDEPSEPPPPGGRKPDKLDHRLGLNISVQVTDDNSFLISWERMQRTESIDFCKDKYNWKLQVLTWEHSELPKVYMDIWNQSFYHNASKVRSTRSISISDCYKNESSLNITVSNSTYYKFQILVYRVNRSGFVTDVIVSGSNVYASHLHYFGSQSMPSISYPREGQVIPAGDHPCVATGDPEPIVRVFKSVDDPAAFTCVASNIHVNNPHEATFNRAFVSFRVEQPAVDIKQPSPKPRCEPYAGICSEFISLPRDRLVNITTNISILEERAFTIFGQIDDGRDTCKRSLKEFVCNSLFPPCHPDGLKRNVCWQSCMEVKKCGGKTFQTIQKHLPSSSNASRNCSNLVDTEAGDAPECIILMSPKKDQETFTDGSCLVGKGQSYSDNINVTESGRPCISWNLQDFYQSSMFPELRTAGKSCRNPGGISKKPWCYVNLTSNAAVRWEYCDIEKCPTCQTVPDECKDVQGYSISTKVFISKSQQQADAIEQCIPDSSNSDCYEIWRNIACHLAFPNCVESTSVYQKHSPRQVCRAYCERIKEVTHDEGSCPIPNDCDMSMFVHQLPADCSVLPEENCISAELDPPTDSEGISTADDDGHKQGHLALSIFVAAAVCLISVLVIAGIIIGYCCCCYCGEQPNRSALIKPIPNPLDNPVFATMKFKYVPNPDYSKTSIESTSAFADKSLRPISKTQIHYIRDLGSGNFGLVYQGKVDKIVEGEEFTMAAIKTLREGSSAEGMKNFLHEAKLACQFDHDNIIKLYGICMSEGFYCLVFEYMDLGDLNEYLRGSASSTQRRYMNPLDSTSRSRTESSLSNNPPRLNIQQLVSICHQIALGMEYFASLNHVHRDLATRNCLVATGLVVKIGDFGMSQTLYHSDYYKQRGEQALPVRWMAPEAFIYGRFSSEGDVWSFGVVMWEVFSFAMQPYYGKMNDQVMNEVRRGHTLSQPDDCPSSIFEIMRSCWQMEPHRRPTFSELVDELNTWRPTHCSTSTALESQGSIRDDIEDSVSLPSIQDKDIDLESSVFDECNMSGTEEDIAD